MAIVGKAVSAGGGKSKPKFEYSGEYNVRDDGVVELLTSGTLQFSKAQTLDVFMVGGGGRGGTPDSSYNGGGGGGGGGQARTFYNVKVQAAAQINVEIGSGGTVNSDTTTYTGGDTIFGQFVAYGALNCKKSFGSSTSSLKNQLAVGSGGGSGGGAGVPGGAGKYSGGGNGGSDGGNGSPASVSDVGSDAGYGQMATTREFGEPAGKLYAGGGGGGGYLYGSGSVALGGEGGGGNGALSLAPSYTKTNATPGEPNTGSGGGGGSAISGHGLANSGAGGSGIVCIRTALGVETEVLDGHYRFNSTLTKPSLKGQVVDGYYGNNASKKMQSIGIVGSDLCVKQLPLYGDDLVKYYNFDSNTFYSSAFVDIVFSNCQVRKEFYDWFVANSTKS